MNCRARSPRGAVSVGLLEGLRNCRYCGDTELAVAGVLQLPGFPPALALCAGRGDEEPVGEGDRGEQRQDAFEQLPTGTHECQTAPSDVYLESAPDAPQRLFILLTGRTAPGGVPLRSNSVKAERRHLRRNSRAWQAGRGGDRAMGYIRP